MKKPLIDNICQQLNNPYFIALWFGFIAISYFMVALDTYFIDTGDFPTSQHGLKALRARPEGVASWKGPYLTKEIPNDPWGTPYIYRAPGRNGGFEIVSLGADRREGGDEDARDIASWESAN